MKLMLNQAVNKLKFNLGKSKFVICFLLSFVLGIFLGDLVNIDLVWLVGIVVGVFLVLIIYWKDIVSRFVLIGILGFSLSVSYFQVWNNHQKNIDLPFGKEIAFESVILGHPEVYQNKAHYLVKFQSTKIEIISDQYPQYHYGDKIRVEGVLKKASEYKFYEGILGVIYIPQKLDFLSHQGNYFTKNIYFFRDKFEEILNNHLTEPYSSFAAGLVLGSKRNIPDSLMADFNRTGTTHIIAVSGYNITIIIVYAGLLLGIISQKTKFWGSLALILFFIIITGASASVIRAGLLAGLITLGHFQGRRVNLLLSILLVAFLMLLFNPYAIKFNISFQLSFLSFLGLAYLSPQLKNLKIVQILPKSLSAILSETLAAQIMVLPLLIYYFGTLSIISPLVNLLILWIIPITMLLVFLIGLGGLVWGILAKVFSWIGLLLLKYIIVVIEYFARISWASLELKLEGWWWLILIYLIIGILFLKNSKKGLNESET